MIALKIPAIPSSAVALTFDCPNHIAQRVHELAAKYEMTPDEFLSELVMQPLVDQLTDTEALDSRFSMDARLAALGSP